MAKSRNRPRAVVKAAHKAKRNAKRTASKAQQMAATAAPEVPTTVEA